jgi:hypothetical protein
MMKMQELIILVKYKFILEFVVRDIVDISPKDLDRYIQSFLDKPVGYFVNDVSDVLVVPVSRGMKLVENISS